MNVIFWRAIPPANWPTVALAGALMTQLCEVYEHVLDCERRRHGPEYGPLPSRETLLNR